MKKAPLRSARFAAASISAYFLTSASPAWAHAFGIRYDLPLPLWLYLCGAGAAVALSFAVMTLFLRDQDAGLEEFQFDLLALQPLGWLGGPAVLNILRALSLAVFCCGIGFYGALLRASG